MSVFVSCGVFTDFGGPETVTKTVQKDRENNARKYNLVINSIILKISIH